MGQSSSFTQHPPEDPFHPRPRIILYAVLRHLVVRPDSAPGRRPQLLLSFAYLENQSPKISAADYSHMVARAAPNHSNEFDLQPFYLPIYSDLGNGQGHTLESFPTVGGIRLGGY